MIKKGHIKNKMLVAIMALYMLIMFSACIFKPSDEYSDSERRKLQQFPEISSETLLSGEFMVDFENYTLDQFPLRETFRRIKSFTALYGFMHRDNNGIYISDGYASAMEYPLNEESLEHAVSRFRKVYDMYISGNDISAYYTVIPDKNYFMAEQSGHLSIDYDKFYNKINDDIDFMEYIDIRPLLDLEDYYRTDTHWRQEKIVDVAEFIGQKMGISLKGEYQKYALNKPFYGVYYGQAALPMNPETVYYLVSDDMEACRVFDFQNNKEIKVYDMEKAYGKDPYEIFLSGSLSLITIENPNADNDKELIIFRDSFGSSLAPLLIDGYSKITLVDIRYISSELLGRFIEFKNQDVLFIYSTLVLNNSETIK